MMAKLYRFGPGPGGDHLRGTAAIPPGRQRKIGGRQRPFRGTKAVMVQDYPIRPIDDSELPAFGEVAHHAFASSWPADQMVDHDRMVFMPERSLAAFDGGRIVGTAVAYPFGLTVPGGAVDAAAVSFVSVLPSHRRRGILSALMRRQLTEVSQGTQPVAALFASEAAIYGRFGYGSAAPSQSFDVRRGDGRVQIPVASGSAAADEVPVLRLAEPKAAVKELAEVYDAIRRGRPGMITRDERWWNYVLADPEFARDGESPLRGVIAEGRSGPRGYAVYTTKSAWDGDGVPCGALIVHELFGIDPVASAALWADMLSRDLMGEVTARRRPVDDPLPYLLPDPRRVRSRASDGLWIRIVDLPAALRRRRYSCQVDVVIEVVDDLLPANSGTWRLVAGGPADQSEPACDRSAAPTDIRLPVSALGAVYLGGTRLGGLAAAGLITELRPGAITALSAAMWWDPAPWSPIMF
jgi:predicted acetyltransferase